MFNIPNKLNSRFARLGFALFGGSGGEQNLAPAASNVTFTGTPAIGQTLTGDYDYTDPNGNAESGSTFQWYRADDPNGTNAAAIGSATALTYNVVEADMNKYLRFGVVPSDGTLVGAEALSEWLPAYVTNPLTANALSHLLFEGTEGSTTFNDEVGGTWTRQGSADITTAQAKWGTSSGDFVADGSYISRGDLAALGTADFTWAAWVYITASTSPQRTLFRWAFNLGYAFRLTAAEPRQLTYYDGGADTLFGVGVPLNQWAFLSVVRKDGQFYGAVNGVVGGTVIADANALNQSITGFVMGGDSFSQEILGYIGEAILSTIAVDEWVENYTPPTAPISDYVAFVYPYAYEVSISGTPSLGSLQTGSYSYGGTDAEDGTTFQWYRSDDVLGTNEVAISGATNLTYNTQAADVGKYLRMAVTPRSAVHTGDAVYSDYSSQIAATMASTRWRVFITACAHTNVSLTEAEFRDTSGNVISTAGATIAASSSFSGSFLPGNMFDGNTGTRWASNNDNVYPEWFSAQFPSPVTVGQLRLTGFGATDAPTAFQVQYSDNGTDWTTLASQSGLTWTAGEQKSFTVQ